MERSNDHLYQIAVILISSMLLTACNSQRHIDRVQTQSVPPSQAIAATTQRLAPTGSPPMVSRPPTMTPTSAQTEEPSTVELGQPAWIGHGMIRKAAFLPGARQIAIGWGDGVSLNDIENGLELWFQPSPTNLIAFDIQPQGQEFAAFLADGRVMIYEAVDGKSRLLEGAGSEILWGDIAWSPDGQTIAYQYLDRIVHRSAIFLYDIATNQTTEVPKSQSDDGTIPELIWSPDGSSITLATLGDRCSRFVDVRTGDVRMVLRYEEQCYSLPPIVFLPNGKTVALQGRSTAVDLVGFPEGSHLMSLEGNPENVIGRLFEVPDVSESLFIEPGGNWIASRGGYYPCDHCRSPELGSEHPLTVWDLKTGKVKAQLIELLPNLSQRYRIASTFDGDSILMMYESGEITRWKYTEDGSGEQVIMHIPVCPPQPWSLAWSADGSRVAFTSWYGGVDVYDTASQKLIQRFDPPLEKPSLNPNGSLLALYDPERKIEVVYHVDDKNQLWAIQATPVLMGATFSPDGKSLAYGSDGEAGIVELENGRITKLDDFRPGMLAQEMTPSRFIWSPNNLALVTIFGLKDTGSQEAGVIVLWQSTGDDSYKVVYQAPNVQANYEIPNLVSAVFNPSGNRVAIQSLPQAQAGQFVLVVYDLEKGSVLRSFQNFIPCAWVNDDVILAIESEYDTRLTRIDVTSGEKEAGNGRADGNVYAPGGIFYAQVNTPTWGVIVVKHWHGGALVAYGNHQARNLYEPYWSPDGRWLVSIGDDGTMRIWPIAMR